MRSGDVAGSWFLGRREEIRRRRFVRRAQRKKRRWFFQEVKRADWQRQKGRWRAGGRLAMEGLLWLFLGAAALGSSGAMWLFTGVGHVDVEESESPSPPPEGEADWEREFFGVRIQLHNGQITVFREKEEVIRDKKNDK